MRKWILSLHRWSQKRRKGASTMEFIVILPLFFLLSLVVWQLVVAGMAVLDTQAALRDAVKIASTTGDEKKAEEQFKQSFGESPRYKVEHVQIKIKEGEVDAEAKVGIPIIFDQSLTPITYTSTSKAPVLQQNQGLFAFGGGILGSPVAQWILTSPFGYRIHPILHTTMFHTGVDLGGALGTPIYAAGDGVVIQAGHSPGYGNLIVIDHGNGLQTYYAHMYDNQIYVQRGQHVKRGQQIASMGSDGRSTGPHLHFEVRRNGQPVNPVPYVSGSTVAQK